MLDHLCAAVGRFDGGARYRGYLVDIKLLSECEPAAYLYPVVGCVGFVLGTDEVRGYHHRDRYVSEPVCRSFPDRCQGSFSSIHNLNYRTTKCLAPAIADGGNGGGQIDVPVIVVETYATPVKVFIGDARLSGLSDRSSNRLTFTVYDDPRITSGTDLFFRIESNALAGEEVYLVDRDDLESGRSRFDLLYIYSELATTLFAILVSTSTFLCCLSTRCHFFSCYSIFRSPHEPGRHCHVGWRWDSAAIDGGHAGTR